MNVVLLIGISKCTQIRIHATHAIVSRQYVTIHGHGKWNVCDPLTNHLLLQHINMC
jgi:hypothetical protein